MRDLERLPKRVRPYKEVIVRAIEKVNLPIATLIQVMDHRSGGYGPSEKTFTNLLDPLRKGKCNTFSFYQLPWALGRHLDKDNLDHFFDFFFVLPNSDLRGEKKVLDLFEARFGFAPDGPYITHYRKKLSEIEEKKAKSAALNESKLSEVYLLEIANGPFSSVLPSKELQEILKEAFEERGIDATVVGAKNVLREFTSGPGTRGATSRKHLDMVDAVLNGRLDGLPKYLPTPVVCAVSQLLNVPASELISAGSPEWKFAVGKENLSY